jgi:DNA-binding NtrC family response regulator
VLVVGEDGSGKDFCARSLHRMSVRANGPFVVLAAGALHSEDVERSLFGDGRTAGKLAEARGGTLFLDEVTDLPQRVQTRLTRVLDRRDGLDVRIIASTQHDLAALAREGSFRSELLHRLTVVKLELLPLRMRTEEIPELARVLLRRHASTLRKNVRTITPDAMALLLAHPWPGNIRELSNVLERAAVLATRDSVTSEDLPSDLEERSSAGHEAATDDSSVALEDATLAFQRRHVARVLASCGGHRARAARLLGVSPATFFRHLRKLELNATTPSANEAR